jgi:AcrR family transcriptional regulator
MTPTARLSAGERRDEVVAAAMAEFAQTGYAGTSTDAIARRSGVSQPYLFQLFGTKKDLFIAAVRHGFGRTALAFETAGRAARAEDPSAEHVLDAMGQAYCDLLRDRELLLCQLQAYAACGDPEIRAAVGDEFIRIYRLVEELSGADDHALEHWFGAGMLMNTAAAIGPDMAEAGDFSFASLGRIAAAR